MIQTNELRCKNLVKCDISRDNGIYEISMIDWLNSTVRLSGAREQEIVSIAKISPIFITEQWLIDFGFKNIHDEGDIKFYHKQGVCYNVVLDHDDIRLDMVSGKDENSVIFWNDSRFSYVHQLQNLYFALTGQELTKK